MSEAGATTPAVVLPPAASDAAPTTPALAAPPSEAASKTDAAPASTKAASANKPAAKEPGPTAASLLAPQRYIPGAPPPEPPKAKAPRQRNKKKEKKDDAGVDIPDAHSAALIESAPGQNDIESGHVAEELVAGEDEIDAMLREDEEKEEEKKGASPAVLAVEKKVKNLQERILRAKKYSETPEKELNEDQKILKANLPTLEATLKEMHEVKTAILNFEAKHELIHLAEKKQRKQDELAKQRQAIRELLNTHESKTIVKVHTVLSFISLSSYLTNPSSSRPFVAAIDDLDRSAISKAASVLLGEDVADKAHVINGLVNDKSVGEVEGVHFNRLRELATSFARPLSPEPTGNAPPQANGASTASHVSGSGMNFTTDSELEQPRAMVFGGLDEVSGLGTNDIKENGTSEQQVPSMDNSIEIVEGNSIPSAHAVQQEWVQVEKEEAQAAHHEAEKGQPEPAAYKTGAIDWAADDEGELPSIDSLNAKFGTSGEATPIDTTPAMTSAPSMQGLPPNAWTSTPEMDEVTAAAVAAVESNAPPATPRGQEDDGWTPAQGPRGASPHRGHRGGFHHRGGGPFEGFRGGGDRGGSGFRGRGRGGGEFRGGHHRGGDGDFRGGHRGVDGDFRGGHRGGERGGGFGSGWQRPAAANGAAEGGADGEGWTRQEGGRGGRGGGHGGGHGFERGRGRGDWRGDGERRGRGGSGFRGRPGPGPPPPAPTPAPAQ